MMASANEPAKVEILGLDQEAMQRFFSDIGEKPFRAVQLIKWLHQQREIQIDAMTNLSKSLRAKLGQLATIHIPEITADHTASDGTRKWLFRLPDGNSIETVYIPTESRRTLCVSSQVGCALNCTFCYTAQQGYNRNLTSSEIIVQLWLANQLLAECGEKPITNVVIMGMGEPLLNFDAIVPALKLMLDDHAYGLSKKRVTLSTSGIVPKMYELAQTVDVSLAVSLHAPNDALRDEIVPINQKYPIAKLMQACKDYAAAQHHKFKVTFEYIMLAGVNDTPKHAKQLINVIQGVPCKVNLIPFNPFPGAAYDTSTPEDVSAFQQKLMRAGINTIVRRTRGEDIDAACGQLAGKVADRTRRSQKVKITQH